MATQAELRNKYNIIPDHSRGQNFLTDKNILKKILAAAELQSKETVIEIGAGTGALTEELAARAGRVIAFEIDKKLAPLLKEKFKDFKNVEIVEGDILKYPISNILTSPFKVVANIPYNITSAILEKFLSAEHKPSLMALLVQREVAERVCALPGEMSFLSAMVQYYGQPKMAARVPAGAFWPKPKVESAILKISDINTAVDRGFEADFFRLVKLGFSSRRKMLRVNLKNQVEVAELAEILLSLGLPPTARAQELNVKNWLALVHLTRDKFKDDNLELGSS